MSKPIDLTQPAYYNNRELSWLAFNKRVLEESEDTRNPMLERLKFLAIFSSNLDEFFMVRVSGLKDQVKAGFKKPDNKSGLTPKEQIIKITQMTQEMVRTQYDNFKALLSLLEREDITFLSIKDLSLEELMALEMHFDEVIFPVLTPMAIDAYRPFPMLANKSLNLAVVLLDEKDMNPLHKKVAIVQVPRGFERFVEVSGHKNESQRRFVLLEDIISHFVHKLFCGFQVESVTQFRITRNADLEIHEEGADLLKEIEEELKTRNWGEAVRLEVSKKHIDKDIFFYLLKELEIHESDSYFINGPLDLTFLFSFYQHIAPFREQLTYEKLIPQPPKVLIQDIREDKINIFDVAAHKDIFLHHPYDSFEPVIDFLRSAAEDPNVLAIKQTVYRVSEHSPIIENLIKAAERGKQVLVLVELRARFNEEYNVHWAKELEKSGCHVIYGKTFLKTHSKISLVVRKINGSIQRFVHLATGNYNEETAKVYTDLGLITSHPEFGEDATNFFNYLSGLMEKPRFRHFSLSPGDICDDFLELIEEEMKYHEQSGNGRIIAKMNSLTYKPVILKLYAASQAGVKIDLIVRGICCLRPGIEGVSENIKVRSIVGRFLEHSRIYYFHQNGREKILLSSADLMTRNMQKRVEIAFPIYNQDLKRQIKQILDIQLSDNVKAREQDQYGCYIYVRKKPDEEEMDSQTRLMELAYGRIKKNKEE
ncbi:RNA degradosome polyphosphate kinase [Bacillus sp. V5-8f]|uniref:RNA degradosome polyphosphate kinase n=1 Tax=Bacillus sp. V5-8f TaxID=2053044 RepID=UPI000C7949A2|nr:RNA degradosome polyphosphate kinase [Bacillus sp. V5-8f]PLT32156.1 RNA degradosome polyphosphate kinase [Bacillus sp. V5-8f]